MPNYRVLVTYDPDRSIFVARAPELDGCSAEGATRAEALTKVEEELETQLHNLGGGAPAAFDDDLSAWTGDLATKVSRTLHRDLAWQAKAEGVELAQLLSELLAVGLDARRSRRRAPVAGSASASAPATANAPANEPNGNSFNERPQSNAPRPQFRGGQRDARDGRYHAIMDDRATFVEYVRGLEGGGGAGGGGRGPMSGGGRNNNYQGGQPRRGGGGGRGPGPGRGPGQGGGQQGGGGGTPPAGGGTENP